MSDNLVQLDLTKLTKSDVEKIFGLRHKLRLMHRWFRCEIVERDGREAYAVYSGDRGPRRYAAYRIARNADGSYVLLDHRSGAVLAEARTVDGVLDALPNDFYYTAR